MIIRLGNNESNIIIHNLIKSRGEIEKSIINSGFILVKEIEAYNPNSNIDESDPNKNHMTKHSILMVLRKL